MSSCIENLQISYKSENFPELNVVMVVPTPSAYAFMQKEVWHPSQKQIQRMLEMGAK